LLHKTAPKIFFSNTRTLPDLTKRQGGWSDRPGADGRKPVDVAPGDGVLANRFLVSKSLCIALLAFGFQKDFRDQTYFAVSECRTAGFNPILILGLTMRVWSARVRARFHCTARPSSPLLEPSMHLNLGAYRLVLPSVLLFHPSMLRALHLWKSLLRDDCMRLLDVLGVATGGSLDGTALVGHACR